MLRFLQEESVCLHVNDSNVKTYTSNLTWPHRASCESSVINSSWVHYVYIFVKIKCSSLGLWHYIKSIQEWLVSRTQGVRRMTNANTHGVDDFKWPEWRYLSLVHYVFSFYRHKNLENLCTIDMIPMLTLHTRHPIFLILEMYLL